MSDPVPATIGSFTVGVARLAEHGNLTYEGGRPNGFSDVYYVVMADASTRPTVSNVSGLPSYGDPADATDTAPRSLRVAKIVFSQVANGSRVWKITVSYELKQKDEGSSQGSDTGRRNIKVSFGVAEDSTDVTTDMDTGDLIVNSAGDPFDSVPQKRTFGAEIRIEFDTATFPLADYLLNGHVNNAAFTIGGMTFNRCCLMLRVEVTDGDDPDHRWHCSYTFTQKINPVKPPEGYSGDDGGPTLDIGWDVAFAQCGFQYLDANDNEKKKKFVVLDENGNGREPSLPMPLDGQGHPAAEPEPYRVRVYPEANFSALSIPTIDTSDGTTPSTNSAT